MDDQDQNKSPFGTGGIPPQKPAQPEGISGVSTPQTSPDQSQTPGVTPPPSVGGNGPSIPNQPLSPEKKKGSPTMLIFGILIVAIIAIIGMLIAQAFMGQQAEPVVTETEVTVEETVSPTEVVLPSPTATIAPTAEETPAMSDDEAMMEDTTYTTPSSVPSVITK